jgi:hypothetical protein
MQVQVTASATPVQTTSSENSKLVDNNQMVDLSLKGRDLLAAVLTTVPGVYFGNAYLTGGDSASESAALQNIQINGGGTGQVNLQVDGITQLGPAAAPVADDRLDPALVALVWRVRNRANPGADETRFVIEGEAYIRMTLANVSAALLEQLKKAGLTITNQKGYEVTGHIAVAKLEAMSQLPFIVWIAPK